MAEVGKNKSGWLNLVVDYGPVIVFFAVYKYFSPADRANSVLEVLAVIKGTVSFMVAAVIALLVSKWRLGKVSPMLWLSTVLIVGFGGLTVLLNDPIWIQVKPTAIYLLFGVTLLAGIWRAIRPWDWSSWRALGRTPVPVLLVRKALEALGTTGCAALVGLAP